MSSILFSAFFDEFFYAMIVLVLAEKRKEKMDIS